MSSKPKTGVFQAAFAQPMGEEDPGSRVVQQTEGLLCF